MSPTSSFDEKAILLLVAEGDQKAFTNLVDRYWNDVYSHSLAYSKSSPRAQEITQDVFLRVWNKRDLLAEVSNFKNYLFILGRHQIISAMRKKLNELRAIDPIENSESVLKPDELLRYKEIYHQIAEAIEKLPPARQRIFKMSRLEGLSYVEIAQRLNISKNTVKDHIVLSLNFLRTYLRELFLLLIFFKVS